MKNIEYEIRKILTDNDFHDSDNEQGKLWYYNLVSDIKGLCEQREDRAREERTEKILEELFNLIDGEEGRYLEVTTAKTIQDMIINKLTI